MIVFKQLGTVGLSTFIPTGRNGRLVYDDPKAGRRKVRYCINENSVFVDDQSEFAVTKALRLVMGELKVDPSDKVLLQFLRISPHNKANGGNLFYEVDTEKEAVDGLFLEDLVTDLKFQAKEAQNGGDTGYLKLQALASHIKGSYSLVKNKSGAELRQIVHQEIAERPMAYYNEKTKKAELFNEEIIRSFLALKAVDKEVVKISADQRKISWDNGDIITEVPAGRKAADYFAEFLGTKDGELVSKRLQKLV